MESSKLKCLIIDDDVLITDLIKHYCSKSEDIDFCITCNSAIDGLKLLSSETFDVLFLDYNMPEMNGKAIMELKQDDSKVIMITSHADFAVESYLYPSIVDYLLKPLSFDRFSEALAKIKDINSVSQNSNVNNETIFIKDGKKWIPVKHSDIKFIKSESNYARIYTASKNIMSLSSLKDLEVSLPDNFIRVHRSYIINKLAIEYITNDDVVIDGHNIPISNSYKHIIKAIVKS